MTDDLVAFLKAQLDAEEQVARESAELAPGEWRPSEPFETTSGVLATDDDRDIVTGPVGDWRYVVGDHEGFGATRLAHAAHIARHDPARVLAEVQAKRRIIDLHSDGGPSQGYTESGYDVIEHACDTCGSHGEYGMPWPCETLRLLALPYASRDGYRAEWVPEEEDSHG